MRRRCSTIARVALRPGLVLRMWCQRAAKCGTMCGRDVSCLEECSTVAGKALAAQQTPTVDHAVVVVGYGTDELGGPYWKIRNSWSDSYGESGYVRVERATTEVSCGVDTRLQ